MKTQASTDQQCNVIHIQCRNGGVSNWYSDDVGHLTTSLHLNGDRGEANDGADRNRHSYMRLLYTVYTTHSCDDSRNLQQMPNQRGHTLQPAQMNGNSYQCSKH